MSGFARCAVCGGGLLVMSRSHGRERAFFYGCLAYHKRGTSVCGNGLQMRIERIDDAVLKTLGGDVLRPAVVVAVVDGVLAELAPTSIVRELDRLRAERQAVEREAANLAAAIAAGGQLDALVGGLTNREIRRRELDALIAAREVVDIRRLDRRAITRQVKERLTKWRAMLTNHVQDGRQVLREVLAGPLRFTPEGRLYRFEGEASIGGLLAGIADLPTFVASPTGTVALYGM
jgi:Recombinase zinc beta ribbon domain